MAGCGCSKGTRECAGAERSRVAQRMGRAANGQIGRESRRGRRGDELGAAGSGWLAERWPKERKRVTQRERCDGVEQSRAEFVLLASCIQWSFNNKEA